jgi:hypothetical protein
MRRLWIVIAIGLVALAIIWWFTDGQHWLAIQTGTCPTRGDCNTGAGPHYEYWSGFGSVFPWSLLTLGGIASIFVAQIRHLNCHEHGCPRIGRFSVAGGEFKYCGKHHPDWKGKHPTRDHILARIEEHKANGC